MFNLKSALLDKLNQIYWIYLNVKLDLWKQCCVHWTASQPFGIFEHLN